MGIREIMCRANKGDVKTMEMLGDCYLHGKE